MEKVIILSKGDYVLLSSFIKNHERSFSNYNMIKLADELRNAKILDSEKIPSDVVRLNSVVKIQEAGKEKDLTIKLVMPAEVDVETNRISIFAPLSAALIGYRKGDMIEWEAPMGTKKYEILDVKN